MFNIYSIKDTYELIPLVERIDTPEKFLTETFFPNRQTTLSDIFAVEYTKQHRRLAPYLVAGSFNGVNVARERSQVKLYKPPMIAARRVIGLEEVSRRVIGEQPIYSTKSAEDRAAELQGRDFKEMLSALDNRREQMAAQLLTNGKITVRGFADNGLVADEKDIVFTAAPTTQSTTWDNANADIYGDIKTASETIQENAGMIPTVMVIGSNVENYLLGNKKLLAYLSIPNRQNLSMMTFAPHYTNPQVRFIGQLTSLNLEIYAYNVKYLDDVTGQAKAYLDADKVIIGVPGRGKMLYGAITYLDNAGNWNQAAAENVPVYDFSTKAQTTSMTIYSRCLPVPEVIDDFMCLKVK